MIQPRTFTWHRFDARTGNKERVQHMLSPFHEFYDARYFKKNGEQRKSIKFNSKTYYKE